MRFEVVYMIDPRCTTKKAIISEQFRNVFSSDWQLRLVDHFDHVACLRSVVEHDSYSVFVEEGVNFTPRTEEAFRRCIHLLIGQSWDILYTEIDFMDEQARKMSANEEEMLRLNNLQVHFLGQTLFSGSRCYLVNKWSKHNLLTLLGDWQPQEKTYDIFLRELVHTGRMKSGIIYPFPTVSNLANIL